MSAGLRVLSVGCCDAGVELWLHGEIGDKLERIDGIDLDRNMIRDARNRAAEAGLRGEFKLGNAMDAPDLFAPGSYDAVVCFEVIEHVKEPAELLATLERMVKPGGTVYLSTPDGTFGLGSNPHHLRALRIVDLADLCRRRGRVTCAAVGSDGVGFTSYIPGPRKEDVAIYCGANWNRWHPSDIETKGLGGSETAAIRLAEALNDLGFVVTVYGELSNHIGTSQIDGPADGPPRDVIYRHHSVFDPMERRGAVICSRIPELGDRTINAPTRLLWCHDLDFGDRLTPGRLEVFDAILCLSEFHERHLRGRYPFASEKLLRIRNGINLSYFTVAS